MRWLLGLVALAGGAGIAYVDSRPGWDDTGVSAAALFGLSLMLGLTSPRRPWVWALLVGGGVPAVGLAAGNPSAILALAFSFAGAYIGAAAGGMVLIGSATAASP